MTIRSREAAANDALTKALLGLAAQGQRPRCADGEVAWMFLDENPRPRAIAATYCAGCVVWSECDEVGRYQRFGVWAHGSDETSGEESCSVRAKTKPADTATSRRIPLSEWLH
jgi:hypothetical protein